ncbi:FGGY family carbohydrate kinase [Serratia entomophila]|uniref:FGGY family carbohydrate kinase n=1 Tax=Serratia entomophila TaxID=42906 RepID=UPI0021779A2F|nr:FGGY-family carbohydrate kinase [Serratia entomophila]CAI0887840.1 Glycerol kinase [Serratia entomophila]CAI1525580.1 Glycerol kinase [Serratia entomophila]CAI1575066.1 Glycerol kinase [Serratia entomophila]CAI1581422.1 Glycerol kinase [Serratia entomophila]CAI1610334.1 Glycerol kinase [Serratia entomophila]
MSKRDCIVALDEGTSNAKAVVVDRRGGVIAMASRPLTLITPQAGWVEQRGEVLLEASLAVLREAISLAGEQRIAAIAISNQRETAIGWRRSDGKPLGPALTWQCSRSADFCEQLRRDRQDGAIRRVTGLPVSPLFSASKMRWLLDHTPDGQRQAMNGDICLGTIDAWLLWHLSGGKAFCCDWSNAARTQLFNLAAGDWDDEMLTLFGIPRGALPQVRPSADAFGVTLGVPGIADGIPICAMMGDSHAALYGHALGRPGQIKATYGTGSSVMAPLAAPIAGLTSLAATIAWHDGQRVQYALEGNIPHTGDAIAWMLETTGLGAADNALLSQLPASVADAGGVYFVPALTGAGAPWWDERARGVICGLSRSTRREHLVRASLEAIAYQIADVIEALRQQPEFVLHGLMADGGPSRNDWLMQFQADLLGCPVRRSTTTELSALGVALMAMRRVWGMNDRQLGSLLPAHDEFEPDMQRHRRLQDSYCGWRQAVQRTLWHPQPTLSS